ncbi:conserved hypothetical protein [Aspergillus terreus NIH2624]|uniref:ubiquitinyl hydrolase 1 n=1 Tax=Aspergillus terreus (strain NIH 2624 / FGSC A1156) TaxID=341663 RepID=Q0CA97_ASPTN|nr:uncharacterized protein ATEG_09387 [Aspergillus terreus NIH2624]EAU30524.1 conserved hypothetical protein [Aspergillus terreus NIH2624]
MATKKSQTSIFLSRPHLRSFFSSPSASGDASEQQKKVKIISRRISQLGITGIKEEHMAYALQSTHAQGDVDKAFDLLLLLEDSIEGVVRGYTPSTKLLGAENREMVTCYLDALLFAMFARFDCFEPILYKTFDDEPRRDLAILLRFWVNMLRSGRLITTDITKHLQEALAKCGWKDAAELRQQDASEAFTFITEKLELPLLTLKMDIYHTGKEDERDDHKFVNERLLEIAIPEPSDGKTVTLEDCLENYFNNRIEVKRYLERQNTSGSTKSLDSLCKGVSAHIETVEVSPSPTGSPTSISPMRLDELQPISSVAQSSDQNSSRTRRDSIVQERFVPDPEGEEVAGDSNSLRRGSYRKEVMMPAWQFFSLIPWYTDNTPKNDAQIATHFSTKRPMLGICLKRYSMTPAGRAVRLNTFVDIPTEIGLPHFIQDDSMDEEGPIYGNFKLSLQAMVCHRGNSVDSGHYISIVRGTNAGVAPTSSHSSQSTVSDPPQYWMRFDDLARERVTLVDIEQALKHESPYLLFYQILPINEDAAMVNLPHHRIPSSESEPRELNLTEASQRSVTDFLDSERVEGARSNRPSFEITGPEHAEIGSLDTRGRKYSVGFSETTEPMNSTGWPQIHSVPSTSPKLAPESDGRSSFSFSRRGSRTTRSNPGSRAGSQASESRFSLTFSRFTGRLNRDKPNSDEGDDEVAVEVDPREDRSAATNGEMKDNSARRTKEDEKQKGKLKSRERIGRKLERECIVM